MKIGIISDIHSNLPALIAVLNELRADGIGTILCAGDIVGYNPFPNECIKLVLEKHIECISGNHDYGVVTDDYSRFNLAAAQANAWTRSVLPKESIRFLSSLPSKRRFNFENRRIVMIHGSPQNQLWEYVFEYMVNLELLVMANAEILILGHTHVPYVKFFPQGLILNPGSVGQPRDGDWRASYAVLDIKNADAEIHRIEYDVYTTVEKIRKTIGIPAILADRLLVGL